MTRERPPQNFRKEESFDTQTNKFIDDIRWQARTPGKLLPATKPEDEEYNYETQMFKTGDDFSQFMNSQKIEFDGPSRSKTPLKPPEAIIGQTVRMSNNPDDVDIDKIIKKLMINRTHHKDYDPIMAREKVRYFMRDLVF